MKAKFVRMHVDNEAQWEIRYFKQAALRPLGFSKLK
jgi:hypothetical protein